MSKERYVGERRALWHFLAELKPLVVDALGEDSLLRHRIDQALKSGDLEMLRNARRIFHHHPDALKRQLMRGIFEGAAPGEELPRMMPEKALSSTTKGGEIDPDATPVIRFDAFPAASADETAVSVELASGEADSAPVRVMIEPGTLPRSAAETLRQVASWIESDRRVLSSQHWAMRDEEREPADETIDKY